MTSKINMSVLAMLIVIVTPLLAIAQGDPEVDGVFGLAPVEDPTALALWVPVQPGTAVAGVRWFNNDGDLVWPQMLAVAGDPDQPEDLSDATPMGADIAGPSSAWTEFTFPSPLASETDGFYLIFRLPAGGDFEFEGAGGGAGLGYLAGDGTHKCWITADGDAWAPFAPDFQMAVLPVVATDKSGTALVLARPSAGEREDTDEPRLVDAAEIGSLTCAPNPFNPQTEIRFSLPQAVMVKVGIFDVRGRLVRQLHSGRLEAGEHSVTWQGRDDDGRTAPSGVYIARLEAGSIRMTHRLTLVQ